jgi:hypothetical protein
MVGMSMQSALTSVELPQQVNDGLLHLTGQLATLSDPHVGL